MIESDPQKALLSLLDEVTRGQERTAETASRNEALSEQLKVVYQGQIQAVSENTQAVLQNTQAQSSGEGIKGVASTLGSALLPMVGSALKTSPLVAGLTALFGGGSKPAPPPPLVPFVLPQAVKFEGAVVADRQEIQAVDYGAGDRPRPAGPGLAPQVTVQVQAMDSRSFLDHSDEIARAVREAMLNSHSLNDVVQEL